MLTTEKRTEKGISDIVGALSDPIIVMPGGWGDSLPEWIKTTITLERLCENIKSLKGEVQTGTDAEACAYLFTASLTAPMGHDWSQIYLYIATQVFHHQGKGEMPSDIAVDKLDDGQMRDLLRLKGWLYQQRIKIRLERERAGRKQQKVEQAASKEAEQPSMFKF